MFSIVVYVVLFVGCCFMDSVSKWYLVQCKPKDSFRAEMHLQNQGFECFHPTLPIKRKIRGKIKTIIEPLFPFYLFMLLSNTQNWSSIRSTRGVSRIVRFKESFAVVSHELIDGLRLQCNKLHGILPESLYKVGQKVRVTDGCFKDIEAIITATKGEERVILLLNLLGRSQELEMPVDMVVGF